MGTFTIKIEASTNAYYPVLTIVETDGAGTIKTGGTGARFGICGPYIGTCQPINGVNRLRFTDTLGQVFDITDDELDPINPLYLGITPSVVTAVYNAWKNIGAYLPTAL